LTGEDSPQPYDEVADMTGRTDDALVLMELALVSGIRWNWL
jgi:hypothetical protein